MLTDFTKTSATRPIQKPIFKEAIEKCNQSSMSFNDMKDIWAKLPDMKRGLRKNATDLLEKLLLKHCVWMAEEVMKSGDSTPTLSSSDLADLSQMLATWCQAPGVLDISSKLSKWITDHAAHLAAVDLDAMLLEYLKKRAKDELVKIDPEHVKALVKKCGGKIPEELNPKVVRTVYEAMRAIQYYCIATCQQMEVTGKCWIATMYQYHKYIYIYYIYNI